MLKITQIKYSNYAKENNRSQVTAELWCDTESDLPVADGIDGYLLMMGSIAYVITTDTLYVMDSGGTWHKSGGQQT